MTTATNAISNRYNDELAARRFADVMTSLLRDYIPEHSRRHAWETLVEHAMENKLELTTFAMRKEWEAWKSTQLDIDMVAPFVMHKPPER